MLEKLDAKRIHEVSTQESTVKSINLCGQDDGEDIKEMEITINYTYKDSGRQLMILDLGAPTSLAGALGWNNTYKSLV